MASTPGFQQSHEDNALTLYVKNIPPSICDLDLKALFAQHGTVRSCIIVRRKEFPRSNRGYILMSSLDQCTAAITNLNGYTVQDGWKIYVEFKMSKEQLEASAKQQEMTNQNHNLSASVPAVSGVMSPFMPAQGGGRGAALIRAMTPIRSPTPRIHDSVSHVRAQYWNSNQPVTQPVPPSPSYHPPYATSDGPSPLNQTRPSTSMPPLKYSQQLQHRQSIPPQQLIPLHQQHVPPQQHMTPQYHSPAQQQVTQPLQQYPGSPPQQYPSPVQHPVVCQQPYSGLPSLHCANSTPHRYHSPELPSSQQNGPPVAGQAPAPATPKPPSKCVVCTKPSGKRCQACKTPYCSNECQYKHWHYGGHKTQCRDLKKEENDSGTEVDLDKFDVCIHENVITALKEMPEYQEAIQDLTVDTGSFSDTESMCSDVVCLLPVRQSLQVKLSDFVSPSQFFVQIAESPQRGLPKAYECSLAGVRPCTDRWTEETTAACSSIGLMIGGLCTVLRLNDSSNQVKLTVRSGADLAEELIKTGAALPDAVVKHQVEESVASYLRTGQVVRLLIDESSVKGVASFYAQIHDESMTKTIREFASLQPQLTHYCSHIANKPPTGYRPALHEFVLAPYQDSWYRAQVTGIKDFYVTVLFIDYGNSEVLLYHQLMPMPRHFCSLPAMAVQGELYQLKDATNTVDQQMAGDQIKALISCETGVTATIEEVQGNKISVSLLTDEGKELNDILLQHGYAKHVQQTNGNTGPQKATVSTVNRVSPGGKKRSIAERLVTTQIPAKQNDVSPVTHTQPHSQRTNRPVWMFGKDIPLVSSTLKRHCVIPAVIVESSGIDSLYAQPLNVATDVAAFNEMIYVQSELLADTPVLKQLVIDEVVFNFMPESQEWDRVVIVENSSPDYVLVRSADYGTEYRSIINNMRQLTEDATRLPLRAVKLILQGVSGDLLSDGRVLLSSLAGKRVEITILDHPGDACLCNMTSDEGENINEALAGYCIQQSDNSATIGATVIEDRLSLIEARLEAVLKEKALLVEENARWRQENAMYEQELRC